jgi:hypothetical protein
MQTGRAEEGPDALVPGQVVEKERAQRLVERLEGDHLHGLLGHGEERIAQPQTFLML